MNDDEEGDVDCDEKFDDEDTDDVVEICSDFLLFSSSPLVGLLCSEAVVFVIVSDEVKSFEVLVVTNDTARIELVIEWEDGGVLTDADNIIDFVLQKIIWIIIKNK